MTNPRPSAYTALEMRFQRILTLEDVGNVLHWDMSAMMPPGGAGGRSRQMAELKGVGHALLTSSETGDLLGRADRDRDALSPWQRANLKCMNRMFRHATALSEQFVSAFSKASSACEIAWGAARADADFKAIEASLENMLSLVREAAAAKAQAFGVAPYDALLDEFEPGMASAEIDALFAGLEAFLPGFLGQVLERQDLAPAPLTLQGPFPADVQKQLGHRLMAVLGFDFEHGRLDTSVHPFCGGTSDDVRITTRFDEDDFATAMMGVLHETGHALYEQGLPGDWQGQPVGRAPSMGAHESQSLLVEMQVCRSRPFQEYWAPLLRQAFAADGPAFAPDNLYRLATRVEPGCIRVDSDEVTYPLHVMLRYRLERAMIAGDLAIRDLPGAWNEGMEKALGIRPPNDAMGCLQDIHWYCGLWGYFPTYTLGAMAAAQLYQAAAVADPEIPAGIATGDFAPLTAWMRANVHALGASRDLNGIMAHATGHELGPAPLIAHLEGRYLPG